MAGTGQFCTCTRERKQAYDWYYLVLYGLGEGHYVEEAGEVELVGQRVSKVQLIGGMMGWGGGFEAAYGRGEKCERDGLLCPCHGGSCGCLA